MYEVGAHHRFEPCHIIKNMIYFMSAKWYIYKGNIFIIHPSSFKLFEVLLILKDYDFDLIHSTLTTRCASPILPLGILLLLPNLFGFDDKILNFISVAS